MRYANGLKLLLTALSLTVFTTACSDGPMAPEASDVEVLAAFGKPDKGGKGDKGGSDGGTTTTLTNVQWITPLAQDVTVSQVCEFNRECSLEITELGVWLNVPNDALSATTTLTMTALAGADVNFVFGPHGTQFISPVTLKIEQANTNVVGKVDVWVSYWENDPSNVIETFEAKLFKGKIMFQTDHFSGYALAM